jgi:hypothetical protein
MKFRLERMHQNPDGPGIFGNGVRLRADVALGNRIWVSQPVSVMNLDDLTSRFGTRIDGLLGQDILREFRSIRINYHTDVIELEQ